MAARGTGLPGAPDPGVTSMVDVSGSAGIGERAAAGALERMRASIDDGMKRFVEPLLDERAKELAAQQVAAGDYSTRLALNPDDQVFNRAVQTAHLAATRTKAEELVDNLAVEHAYDPQAYRQRVGETRTAFLADLPGSIAIEAAAYFDDRAQARGSTLEAATAERGLIEAKQSVDARIKRLEGRMLNLDPGSIEFQMLAVERDDLQTQRVANPAFPYSEDERINDDADFMGRASVAAATRGALAAAEAAGGGLPGQSAANRFLTENILENPALADLDPNVRVGLFDLGIRQVDAHTRAEMEERRAAEAAERARKEAERENYERYQLAVVLGEITSEADIEALTDIDAGQKAGLVAQVRTQRRAERTEQRAAALEVWQPLVAEADAGLISDGEIAGYLESGLIDDTQARTLRVRRSRALRPLMGDVMAPFEDAARRPGAQLRPTAELRARVEADAAAWVAANPESTLNDRLTYGKTLAERYMGGAQAGASGQQRDRNAERTALANERRARAGTPNPMSAAEYDSRRREIDNGR